MVHHRQGRLRGLTLGLLAGCGPGVDGARPVDTGAEARVTLELPPHFPDFPRPLPTRAQADLGRLLFHDFRLAVDDARSCGICHEGRKGYTDGFVVAVGALGDPHTRNTLSLLNLAWRGPLTWVAPDLTDLTEQMDTPLFGTHPVEMGADPATLPGKLREIPLYPPAFARAYPSEADPLTLENIQAAILAYETLIVAGDTPFDRYLQGDPAALGADAEAGRALFFSERLGCGACHGGLFLNLPTDPAGEPVSDVPEYLNIGMYDIDGAGGLPPDETGLYARTGDPADMGRFRVPSLRGVAETGPWGHDGSFSSLGDIIDAYARGGRLLVGGPWPGDGATSPHKDPRITGFALTEAEKGQLIAFLEALSDPEANARPFLQTPFCPDEPDTGDAGCVPVEG